MARKIEIELFQFNELSPEAKRKALAWAKGRFESWRDSGDYESEIETFRDVAEGLGFTIDHNGGPWWGLYPDTFYFEGSFHRPTDEALDTLAKGWNWDRNKAILELIDHVRAIRPGVWFRCGKQVGGVAGSFEDIPELVALYDEATESGVWDTYNAREAAILEEEGAKADDLLSDLHAWGLSLLRAQDEYLESDEYAIKVIDGYGYEFTEDGSYFKA